MKHAMMQHRNGSQCVVKPMANTTMKNIPQSAKFAADTANARNYAYVDMMTHKPV